MFGLNFERKIKKESLERRVESMQVSINTLRYENTYLQEELGRLKTDFNVVEAEFDKMRMKVIKLDKAGGGFWKTAKGHTLRIRDMSTDHIHRCLSGNFAKPHSLARFNMERELDRRDEEAYWRSKPMPEGIPVPPENVGWAGRSFFSNFFRGRTL